MKISSSRSKDSIAMIVTLYRMWPKVKVSSRYYASLLAFSAALLLAPSAQAAANTWSGAVSADWNTAGNWGSGIPDATSTATFSNNVNPTITLSSAGTALGLSFTGGSAGVFTVGTTGGPALTLATGSSISNGAANIETVNAPLILGANSTAATYTFSNSSSLATNTLIIGGSVTGAAASGTTVLTLSGSNSGNNMVKGVIGNGTAGGNLGVIKSGGGTWILSAANNFSGGLSVTGGTLDLGANTQTVGAVSLSGTSTLKNGTVVGSSYSDSATSGTATVSAVLAGSGSLTESGAGGTLVLSGANTYTGSTTISAGILSVGNGNALSRSSSVTITGGTLESNGQTYTINNLSGTGGTLDSNIVSGGSTVTINQTVNGTFSGNITYSASGGTFNVTKNGAATLTLAGTNTWNNSAIVNNGTLKLDASTGSLATTVALKMGGGTFNYDNTATASIAKSQSLATLAFGGGDSTIQSTLGGASSATLTFGATSIPGTTGIVTGNFVTSGGTNGATNSIILTGASAGFLSQALFFNGADYAYLNSAGGYVRAAVYGTDATFVNATSTLSSGNNNRVAASISGQAAVSVSTIKFDTSSTVNLGLSGTLTLSNNGILRSGGGATTISGGSITTSLTGNSSYIIRTDTSADSLAISSAIGNNASNLNGVVKSGAGTLTLSGTNTYSGTTTINGGILSIGQNVNLGNQVTGATLNINNGTLQATGTFGLFQGTAGTHDRAVSIANNANIDVTGSNNLTVSGVVSNATLNGIVAAGSLTKSNTGVLTLSGANTYSGGTTVNGGVLLANGTSSTGTGAVTVASGAFLGGSGTIAPSGVLSGNAAVTVASGGTLSPSNASGTGFSHLTLALNAGATVNLAAGSKLAFNLGSTAASDEVLITGGSLALNGQNFSDFTFVTEGTFGAGTYTLMDSAGGITGSLGTTTGMLNGFNAVLSVTGNDVFLTVAVVPEPGTWALMLGGLVMLVVMQRRRRANG